VDCQEGEPTFVVVLRRQGLDGKKGEKETKELNVHIRYTKSGKDIFLWWR